MVKIVRCEHCKQNHIDLFCDECGKGPLEPHAGTHLQASVAGVPVQAILCGDCGDKLVPALKRIAAQPT